MKRKLTKKLYTLAFILGGTLTGLAYYYIAGCRGGSCPITANPFGTMVYTGLIGWLLSFIFRKECNCGCNT